MNYSQIPQLTTASLINMAKKRGQSGTFPFLPIMAHSFLQNPTALLHCFCPWPQAAGGPFAVTNTTAAHWCVPSGVRDADHTQDPHTSSSSASSGNVMHPPSRHPPSRHPPPRRLSPPLLHRPASPRVPICPMTELSTTPNFPYAELDGTTRSGAKSNPFHQDTKHMYKMKC